MSNFVTTVTSENFSEFTNNQLAVVDFWATWCGPCKMLAPVFEEVAQKLTFAKFGKVDVDNYPELARQFRIMSIPHICIFKNGELVDRIVGFLQEDQLAEVISKHQ